ncbi:MAG TPA: LysR family transcriptional regulator [Hypericibacter adhaerens]|jgi:DNA-binding transcriptional LysR family regulator|uniref:LysR family transcriptional regulator n=1 Tax=Hypericibacter adhaerens TaxID=2602016 RepID=A0A5J6MWN3_9PROT|nr:LysR family transcriptional regulator [Hypericibacter adhaerens]QEX22048.1 LysR family transcriptional regulator [Hypericibacter adhaerens]HWA46294.1 LysR family transcriptional regulator [Hypericibacter adhaerens]
MSDVDLNLLAALDVLLAEGSVTGAARRLGLSASAMSRTLTRLRAATGDPLLVRAGRRLVPTPRAAELRDRVHELTRDAQAVLRPQVAHLDVASLELTFTLRVSEAFLEYLSGPVAAAVTQAAPRVCLRFAPKPNKDAGPLREGLADLEIGVLGTSAPEIRTQLLFRDRYVGVARIGHPLLRSRAVTPERYAACNHVVASKDADTIEPIDAALQSLGLKRAIRVVVPGYPDAMRIARQSDLVALVPQSCLGNSLTADRAASSGLASFELPVPVPEFNISAMWHPRMDADPAHRWLRNTVMSVCRTAYASR